MRWHDLLGIIFFCADDRSQYKKSFAKLLGYICSRGEAGCINAMQTGVINFFKSVVYLCTLTTCKTIRMTVVLDRIEESKI